MREVRFSVQEMTGSTGLTVTPFGGDWVALEVALALALALGLVRVRECLPRQPDVTISPTATSSVGPTQLS